MDYQSAGVSIDSGNRAVQLIKDKVRSTFTPNVLGDLGGFAGFFELPEGYKKPVLVSCTDGVGTKVKLAIDIDKYDTIGQDLVAMCVNDMICTGATPLYFLDYIACHKLIPEQMNEIIGGITDACKATGMALIGGEMAEMNDVYKEGDFDLAGFSVGIVEKDEIIDGSAIRAGQTVYALPSSGFHSNGYSLVRRVIAEKAAQSECELDINELLTPTTLYVKAISELRQSYSIAGIANITGGGLVENIERIVPKHLGLEINREQVRVLDIFRKLQRVGGINEEEMWRVFNMGVGMVVITDDAIPESAGVYPIGRIRESA
ncbi:MAG: phosphoribosylformylglycinamidine cyclo-ligase [bacterium]|nr:phosphoribosylformylglycinamidine cyclo-ligase [bacterium]